MQHKHVVIIAAVTLGFLLVPFVAMQLTDEVRWGAFDFVFMGALLFGAGYAFDWVSRRSPSRSYRFAVGVAVASAVLLVYVNAAVGIVGDAEEDLLSALYVGGPLAVGSVAALMARFRAAGMARALLAMAAVQGTVALVALAVGWGPRRDVVGATLLFVSLWLVAAALFTKAAHLERSARLLQVR